MSAFDFIAMTLCGIPYAVVLWTITRAIIEGQRND